MIESRRRLVSRFRQPHHHAVEDDVFARGQLHVEADPELDERRQPPRHADRPGVGAVDAREAFQQRALAGAVAADDPEELALADVERDVVERAQDPVVAGRERSHHALLQRVDAVGRDPEGLLQAAGLDRDRARRRGSAPAGGHGCSLVCLHPAAVSPRAVLRGSRGSCRMARRRRSPAARFSPVTTPVPSGGQAGAASSSATSQAGVPRTSGSLWSKEIAITATTATSVAATGHGGPSLRRRGCAASCRSGRGRR